MKFLEIFLEEGLYKADSFAKGLAIKIKKNHGHNELTFVSYKDKETVFPKILNIQINSSIIAKEYTKVFNKNQLF